MEIIVKVGKSDEPEFWSQDFSESLLSSVEAALLACHSFIYFLVGV